LKVLNQTRNIVLAENAELADSFLSRMKGLLGRDRLDPNQALVITRCQQIHMFFMRFAIDAVFIDSASQVVGLVENIKPSQMSSIFWKANRVIELPSGSIARTKTSLGDHIQISS
jgi:uncharacterized protein